jgi:cell shape-determining protein MreD
MKNKPFLNKIAAILAFIIGIMAVIAGGRVLLGILPDYYVIDWLPIYNFVVGFSSAFFASIVIWKNNRLALTTAISTFGAHTVVMIILQTAYRNVVAPDSLMAMTVRLIVWGTILALLIFQHQKNNRTKAGESPKIYGHN